MSHGNPVPIGDKHGIEIDSTSLTCLDEQNWLTDKILDFWIHETIENYSSKTNVLFLGSYFYKTLSASETGYCHDRVQRWTLRAKIDVTKSSFRYMIVPINTNNTHWTVLVIDLWNKTAHYYDSVHGGDDNACAVAQTIARNLVHWFHDEHVSRNAAPAIVFAHLVVHDDIPRQPNAYDCGLYVLQTVENVLRRGCDQIAHMHIFNSTDVRTKMKLAIIVALKL